MQGVMRCVVCIGLAVLGGCGSIPSGKDPSFPSRLEHVALNVPDPEGMAKWWCEHLGMKVIRSGPQPARMHFLADPRGNVLVEIYHNPSLPAPDYASMNPLALHIAFSVEDVKAASARLIKAGARPEGKVQQTEAGDSLAMLRDPWGVPIQLAARKEPMLNP